MSYEIHIPGTVSQREAEIEAALAELFGFAFIEGAKPGKSFAMEHAKVAVDKLRALMLAAPAASKLAEEPAQELASWTGTSATDNQPMPISTLREQVESQARRIEALENNKEAGK